MELPLRVVESPAGTTPAGLNLAVAASDGEIVARVDSQSRVPPDYIERAVSTLTRTGAANVGGVQRPIGAGGLPSAIAAAMASAFGGGPAAFRHGPPRGTRRHRLSGGVRPQRAHLGWWLRRDASTQPGLRVKLAPARARPHRMARPEPRGRLRPPAPTTRASPASTSATAPGNEQWWMRHPRSLRLRQLAAPALVGGPRGLGGRTRPGTPTRCRNSGAVRGSLRNCRRPGCGGFCRTRGIGLGLRPLSSSCTLDGAPASSRGRADRSSLAAQPEAVEAR